MKKCFCLILALLTVCAALPALAEEPFMPGPSAPKSLTADEDRFYFVSDGTVYGCERNGFPEPLMTGFPFDGNKAYQDPAYVNLMFVDGNALYGVNTRSGDLYGYALEAGTAREISHVQLDFSPLIQENDGYTDVLYLEECCVADHGLWGAYWDFSVNRRALIRFDLETGAAAVYVPDRTLSHLTPYRDGALLCTTAYDANTYDPVTGQYAPASLGVWSPADNTFTELCPYPMEYSDLRALAYDPAADAVYFYTPNRIYRMVSGRAPELCAYAPFTAPDAGCFRVIGDVAGMIGETGFVTESVNPEAFACVR